MSCIQVTIVKDSFCSLTSCNSASDVGYNTLCGVKREAIINWQTLKPYTPDHLWRGQRNGL